MPTIRPFRALRYSREMVDDLAAVVAPPYDVISAAEHARLLARDSRNVVRLDLPEDEAGDPPDERYRRAARLLGAWRSDGTLRRDPRPALYPYEQTYTVPGTERVATRRGIFARVVLEPIGAGSGIRAHERTLAEPREDRYRLLRATGVNTSPVVGLGADRTGRVPEWLREIAGTAPVADLVDDAGVRHRLWIATVGEDEARDAAVLAVCEGLGRIRSPSPTATIATRRRSGTPERRTGPVIEGDPAWAEILMLILEPMEGALTVLPTHRVLLGLDDDVVDAFLAAVPDLFDVEAGLDRATLGAASAARAMRLGARAGSGCGRATAARSSGPGARHSFRGCRQAARPFAGSM